ncbi:MAG: hypothetical protein QE285_16480 [Aquabacterium sp.]|nr:hypothetical protein [Aquabacterium sp.]
MKILASLPLLAACLLSGCAATESFLGKPAAAAPAPAPVAAVCTNCVANPVVGYAITRPALCNDYPVTYRVQMPEVDDRVRLVDRSVLSSNGGTASRVANCPQ